MKEELIEYFHGNNLEIENEKQRKRELMSHFPKMLGTVDETRYVLHDDEKQKQTDYFESKPVSPLTVAPAKDEPQFNIRGIGEQQSEKPKKDVSMQTALHGIANFGNKENTLGFVNWKSASTFFGPQKEKNETKAPESPFDFDGNTAKEENIPFNHGIANWGNKEKTLGFGNGKDVASFLMPKKENAGTTAPTSLFDFDGNTAKEEDNPFNHGIQIPGFSTVVGNKPRRTTERNDSLEVEKDKIENSIDSVCNINDKSNFDLNKNNSSSNSKRKLKVHGKPRTKDYAVQINTLIGNLPVAAANILKQLGVGIDIADNLYTTTDKGEYKKRNGIYLGQNNRIVIDSKHVDEYTLISEVFHAAQDQLEMTGTGKSNLEFQEHVIKDLYFGQKFRKTGDYKYFKGLSTTDDEEYANFISNGFDNNGNLYLNNFLMHINSYFDKFQEYYSGSGAYQEPGVDDFNYNWKVILDLFGIKYK